MKPSQKAIEAAFSDVKGWEKRACIDSLQKAYSIDVDPLIEQKDKEIERLGKSYLMSEERLAWSVQRIAELEAENARLHDLVETYCPSDERAGTPDQTRM